jgi:hypothetical protein
LNDYVGKRFKLNINGQCQNCSQAYDPTDSHPLRIGVREENNELVIELSSISQSGISDGSKGNLYTQNNGSLNSSDLFGNSEIKPACACNKDNQQTIIDNNNNNQIIYDNSNIFGNSDNDNFVTENNSGNNNSGYNIVNNSGYNNVNNSGYNNVNNSGYNTSDLFNGSNNGSSVFENKLPANLFSDNYTNQNNINKFTFNNDQVFGDASMNSLNNMLASSAGMTDGTDDTELTDTIDTDSTDIIDNDGTDDSSFNILNNMNDISKLANTSNDNVIFVKEQNLLYNHQNETSGDSMDESLNNLDSLSSDFSSIPDGSGRGGKSFMLPNMGPLANN